MEVLDNVGGLFPLVVSKLNLLQELVGHSLQSIIWPGLEPINSTTVDQGWELPQSVSESVSDRTEGNDDVEVLTATVHKEGKQGQGTEVGHLVSCLGQWSNSLHNFSFFICSTDWGPLQYSVSYQCLLRTTPP